MINLNEIRLLIRKKYKNESEFAESNNISKSKLSLILNGKVSMPLEIADILIKDLDISSDLIKPIFFQ